jgi:hypothetical protein
VTPCGFSIFFSTAYTLKTESARCPATGKELPIRTASHPGKLNCSETKNFKNRPSNQLQWFYSFIVKLRSGVGVADRINIIALHQTPSSIQLLRHTAFLALMSSLFPVLGF